MIQRKEGNIGLDKKDVAQLVFNNLSASEIMELYMTKMHQEVLDYSFLRRELIKAEVINGD